MIKFFRSIRRKLIDEGNLKKYLVYAVGEILLVIIGILIALSLNNLNTEKDLRHKEFLLLQEVRSNLQANLDQFDSNIIWQKNRIKDIEKIIEYSEKDKLWNDSLGIAVKYFDFPEEFFINYSGYESLKSLGLDIISSDSLRNAITRLYEQIYKLIEIRNNQYGQVFYSARKPFLHKNFSYDLDKNTMIPNDPIAILNNQEFTNIVSQRKGIKDYVIGSNQWSIQETKQVIESIDEHLKKIE